MFEDATFDARGAVRNHASQWMMLTAAINAVVVAGCIVIPLLYSRTLPGVLMVTRPMYAPQMQPEPVKIETRATAQAAAQAAIPMPNVRGIRRIESIHTETGGPPTMGDLTSSIGIGSGADNGTPSTDLFRGDHGSGVVRSGSPAATRVSGGVVEGLLLPHATPSYPQIAKAAGVGGDVVLAATISAEGKIEHLRVVSGHPMLREAALEAVKNWRYRPYLLNGQAVEVETTITVRFTLGR